MRSCLPTGKAMRIQMYTLEDEWKTGSYRLSGTLRCWLRTWKRTNFSTCHCRKERHQSGGDRFGSCRIIIRRWYGKIRLWCNCIRGTPWNRRRIEIWYSGIPSAKQDCWCRNRQPRQNGRYFHQGLHRRKNNQCGGFEGRRFQRNIRCFRCRSA